MQQIRSLAEELEGRALQVAVLKEESERAMQEASQLASAARRVQEEAAAEHQRCAEKEQAADELKRQLEQERAQTAAARVALSTAIHSAQMREEGARMIQSRLSAHIRPRAHRQTKPLYCQTKSRYC